MLSAIVWQKLYCWFGKQVWLNSFSAGCKEAWSVGFDKIVRIKWFANFKLFIEELIIIILLFLSWSILISPSTICFYSTLKNVLNKINKNNTCLFPYPPKTSENLEVQKDDSDMKCVKLSCTSQCINLFKTESNGKSNIESHARKPNIENCKFYILWVANI